MPDGRERVPRERETLIFETPEEAAVFRERVAERMRQKQEPGIRRDQEAVAEAVTREFDRRGVTAGGLHQPWEHSAEEHGEAQRLVDLAFKENINVAIGQAQGSPYYPRILDLLHDVLTDQLYDLLARRGLNRQQWNKWTIAGVVMVILPGLLAVLFLFSLLW